MKRIIHTTSAVSEPYPRTTGGDQVVTMWPSAAAELTDTHRPLLRMLSFDLLVQEVERRGWRVCVAPQCRYDVLPAAYPPMGDGDVEMPGEIYKRHLTNVFYTADGAVFCNTIDPIAKQYRYSATTADAHGDVEVWRRMKSAAGIGGDDLPFVEDGRG